MPFDGRREPALSDDPSGQFAQALPGGRIPFADFAVEAAGIEPGVVSGEDQIMDRSFVSLLDPHEMMIVQIPQPDVFVEAAGRQPCPALRECHCGQFVMIRAVFPDECPIGDIPDPH